MEEAFGVTETYDTFCAQLDSFAKLQGWQRSQDEKKNKILNPSKDDFLQGGALLQLQYHDFPVAMVCSLPSTTEWTLTFTFCPCCYKSSCCCMNNLYLGTGFINVAYILLSLF
jgi:hypothetical protein